MKCPNCRSKMFVTDETANSRSHVTFYRCSLCVSEHVSSEPIPEIIGYQSSAYPDSRDTDTNRNLMF
ncbi:MAG: hypothetical protein OEO19_01375 [Gammaproteobacteria bacterium]|nr:hypothetical protein [Gammaproteobacteria bacterium]MDH3449344.1 hypothetical protein [Gammaproteobacteria bacterium]